MLRLQKFLTPASAQPHLGAVVSLSEREDVTYTHTHAHTDTHTHARTHTHTHARTQQQPVLQLAQICPSVPKATMPFRNVFNHKQTKIYWFTDMDRYIIG